MAEEQIRILHVLKSMNPGGIETWLLNVLRHTDRDRFAHHVCTFGHDPGVYANAVEQSGGKIVRCPRNCNLWRFRSRFRRVLREGRYDVVHSHVTLFSGLILHWAAAEGVPMRIVHSHTSQDNKPGTPARAVYRRLMKTWIKRHATHGLAASQPAAAYLFGKNWRMDRRFRILHYGIDVEAFQKGVCREEVRKELRIPAHARVVGHVGNFVPAKNHEFLLRIAAEVLKKRPDVHFLLIGDGPLRPRIEAQVRAAGLTTHIHFAGLRTDVARLMRGAMDFFLFPSGYEGFGISLLEAQTAGLKCLVSSAVPEEAVLLPGVVQSLPLSAGAVLWAEKLLKMLDAPRRKLTSSLANAAQDSFTIQDSAGSLAKVYAEVSHHIASIAGQYA